jgi:DNA repair protein SbcD/Mre11
VIKFLHFADLHLGVENYGRLDPATGMNTRVLDFLRALDAVVDRAIDEQVDAVLFAGDAYRTKDPNVTYSASLLAGWRA